MSKDIICDLGSGIVIRHAAVEDADALAAFNKAIHGESEWDAKGLEDWTLDLISGEGPTFDTKDFTIVEDTSTGEIVSSCCHISQTWAYEGIPFKVGRPELVGTKKEYRRRGLIRRQFEILHQWSEERGELVQVITGIEYYYRQFGYEMGLNLYGGRLGYENNLPKLEEDQEEPYSFRLAGEADIPFLMSVYALGCKRQLVSTVWDEALWRYELTGKRKYNINRREIYIIQDQENTPVGFIGIPPIRWQISSSLTLYELTSGISWSAVTPSVARFLWQKGLELGKEQNQPQTAFGFWLGETHPAYKVLASRLPVKRKPYAYYVRVPHLAEFVKLIAPALEARLSTSAFAHYSGEVKLNFYKDGLLMNFKDGHLEEVKSLGFDELDKSTAIFPPLVFLHLLFGHRNMDELIHAFADCGTKREEDKLLMDILFPKKPSDVWEIS